MVSPSHRGDNADQSNEQYFVDNYAIERHCHAMAKLILVLMTPMKFYVIVKHIFVVVQNLFNLKFLCFKIVLV